MHPLSPAPRLVPGAAGARERHRREASPGRGSIGTDAAGRQGPRIEKGHKPVTDAMRWVGSRFTGADAVDLEHLVIASSGDLAYTVGFERSHVSVDGGPPGDMTLRVTHIYRRIEGDR